MEQGRAEHLLHSAELKKLVAEMAPFCAHHRHSTNALFNYKRMR